MFQRVILGALGTTLLAGAVLASSSRTVVQIPRNPYEAIARRHIAGLSTQDQSLDFELQKDWTFSASTPQSSKTCSTRCSTSCSASCTTTRGCSSNCKRQSDGCGGSGVSAPPRTSPSPPPTASGVVPSASLAAYTLPEVVTVDIGPRATALYHRDTCPWLNGAIRQNHVLSEAQKRYFLPHCLCLTGKDSSPAECAATLSSTPSPAAATAAGLTSSDVLLEKDTAFSIGASKAQVRAIHGTPTSIVANTWHYGTSWVSFQGDVVNGYSNAQPALKVSLGSQTNPSGYVAIGATQAEVVGTLGTPTSVVGNTWHYGNAWLSFDKGRLSGYSDPARALRIR
jgi:hypothetical protein